MTTHVQDAGVETSGTSATVSITTTAGNAFLLSFDAFATGNTPFSISSVTDNASGGSNSWTFSTAQQSQNPPAAGSFDSTHSQYGFTAVAACLPSANGGTTKAFTSVTVTFSTATVYVGVNVSEFSGLPAGSVIMAAASTPTAQNGVTSYTTPVLTTLATALVFASTCSFGPFTGVSSGYTLLTADGDNNKAYNPAAAAGSVSNTFTGSSNRIPASAIAAIGVQPGAAVIDQTATGQSLGSVSTLTLTWPVLPAAGAKVLVLIATVTSISSVVDNGTTPTTFTQDVAGSLGGNPYIYRADNIKLPASGSYTVTVTLTGSSAALFASGRSYLGVAAGGPTGSNTNSGTSNSPTTGNVTPAVTGALVFGGFVDDSGANPESIALITNSATTIFVNISGANLFGSNADHIVTTTSAQGLAWTLGDAPDWGASVAVYSPAPVSPAAAGNSVVLTPPGRMSPAAWGPYRPGTPVLPTPYTQGNPGTPSATATAQSPVATVVVTPGIATATAAALAPGTSSSDSVTPTTATATATGKQPVVTVTVTPGVATATAQALQPSAGNITTVTPGVATATATAQNPGLQISVSVTPGVATATATAKTPVAVVTAAAGHPSATATAQAPGVQVSRTVTPGVATATATALSIAYSTPLVHWGVTFFEPGINAAVTVSAVNTSLAVRTVNATLSVRTLNAVITEGTMQQATLVLAEFNDMTIDFAVTANGSPYNLTGMTLNLLLKSAAGTPDTSALVFSSAGGSPAITITSPTGGLATAQLPNADLDVEAYNFYRLDVVNGSSQQQTTAYGPITWITL